MSARTARWVAGCAAAGAVALIGDGLVLAYVDRRVSGFGPSHFRRGHAFGQ